MKAIRVALVALAVTLTLGSTSMVLAYSETSTTANPNISPADCASCHGYDGVSIDATRTGPHAGYIATSRSCAACHITHSAPAAVSAEQGSLLLPGATTTETCELCHDGTGGLGVYGAIEARGLSVASAHRTETTSVVPGGDASTGGTSTVVFNGLSETLTCDDCHQPHGVDLVEPFETDRRRNASDTIGFYSSQLLRRRPTGSTTDTPVYGSDWCAGCHKGRSTGLHDVINHPLDSIATSGAAAFYYQRLQVVDGIDSTRTVVGSLGGSNFGYVMPWPRTAGQADHKPICQQCHEDARSVGSSLLGSVVASEAFSISGPDGSNATDTPRFQSFPHESTSPSLTIETGDDLCYNCHTAVQLN